jgi:hypothetical protein
LQLADYLDNDTLCTQLTLGCLLEAEAGPLQPQLSSLAQPSGSGQIKSGCALYSRSRVLHLEKYIFYLTDEFFGKGCNKKMKI